MSDMMRHRHLNPSPIYSAAAIGDVIGHGSRADWAEPCRAAADADRSLLAKILRVCAAKVADPNEQRGLNSTPIALLAR